jgi:nitrite reductase/ring-hydroxylating ferredoxin subunit
MTRVLCASVDLDATGGKEIIFDQDGARVSVFVVRHGGRIHGYVNSCPHARLPLNWRDDRFFDITGQYLLCTNHSALFDIATGQCVRGPCKGQALAPYPVRIDGANVVTLA